MRQLFFAIGTAGLFTLGAQAATVCASPADMKALQAAVLEQQLAAAAQICHATEDYARFVATYRDAIMRSDQVVRAFFQHQRSGETYGSYKSRIAHDISLKSLHDPKFCATSKTVFDLALGRSIPTEPPTLVETGYEGCRPLPDKPLTAAMPKPNTVLAAKPPAPVKTAAAQPAWDADHILALLRPVDVPVPTPAPPHAVRALALAHSTITPSSAPLASAPRSRVAGVPLPSPPIVRHRAELPDIGVPPVPTLREPHPEIGHPATRYATVERRQVADEDLDDAEGSVPNAYLPGAEWVGAEADAPPRGRSGQALYRGPDGRWYERIGRRDYWNDGEGE